MEKHPVRKSKRTFADYARDSETQLRQYDELYNFLTTPDFAKKQEHIAGLERYIRAKYHELINNPVTDSYNKIVTDAFAFLNENSAEARIAQAYFLFYMICAETAVAHHFVPLPPQDPEAEDPALCDRHAFNHFVAIAADRFMDAIAIKSGAGNFITNVANSTQELLGLYAMLLPSQPADPVNRPRTRRKRTTT